jgi:hypothetical protein
MVASTSALMHCARDASVAASGAWLPVAVQPESAATPTAIATEALKRKRDAFILFSDRVAEDCEAVALDPHLGVEGRAAAAVSIGEKWPNQKPAIKRLRDDSHEP